LHASDAQLHKRRRRKGKFRGFFCFCVEASLVCALANRRRALAEIEIPTWSQELALMNLNITEIAFDLMTGNTEAFARKRSMAVSTLAQLPHKTRFHELAHVVLGHTAESDFEDEDTPERNLQEVEAEGVALLLCESLELAGADYGRGYIQKWLNGEEIPERSAQRIFGAADRILKAGRNQAAIN
jgi:hypothetical protein